MDLIIVDADGKGTFPAEALPACLEKSDFLLWQLNDRQLADGEYCLEKVIETTAPISRVVLLTTASHGMMGYHKRMVRSNPDVRYWIIVLPDSGYSGERQQLLCDIQVLFQHQVAGYSVLFEDPKSLSQTASMLRHPLPEKPPCVLYYSEQTPAIRQLTQAVKTTHPDWDVIANPEDLDWTEKYARRILLFAQDLAPFLALGKINNVDRVFVWVEGELGATDTQKAEIIDQTALDLREAGFSLTGEQTHILYGYSGYELLRGEIAAGTYSYTALKHDSSFLMWDVYGLPLLNKEYSDAQAQSFLDAHSVLVHFLDEE